MLGGGDLFGFKYLVMVSCILNFEKINTTEIKKTKRKYFQNDVEIKSLPE